MALRNSGEIGRRSDLVIVSITLRVKVSSILTPDIQPEFLQPGPTEAVNAENDCGSSSKGGAPDDTIGASVMTEVENEHAHGEASNEDGFASCACEQPSWFQDQKPHAQAKAPE